MHSEPIITVQDLEDVEQEAYIRGYTDAETVHNFFNKRIILGITHTIVAIVFFIMGLLYTTN